MNCVNHPETPVASYCQNCGKALCNECTRPVGGIIYCEQCLAAKVGLPGAQPGVPFPTGIPVSPSGANPAQHSAMLWGEKVDAALRNPLGDLQAPPGSPLIHREMERQHSESGIVNTDGRAADQAERGIA